jgi:uncharacterized protein (DUF305 family)
MKKIVIAAVLAAAAVGTVALAQQGMHGRDHMMGDGKAMQGMGSMTPKGDSGPSSLALHGVNTKMHEAMAITFTGDADRDFIAGMIPHHQGAIDMAKVVLAFGKDPEVKKLAQDIIKAQEQEIAWMKSWQARSTR